MGQQAWEGVKYFGPLEDQQLLISIRRSELLVCLAITLNKKCAKESKLKEIKLDVYEGNMPCCSNFFKISNPYNIPIKWIL